MKLLTLISLTLVTVTSFAQINCKDMLSNTYTSSASNGTAKSILNSIRTKSDTISQNIRSTGTELDRLILELSKPEEMRTEKDPRWFASRRDPLLNPVTLRLEEQISAETEKLDGYKNQLTVLETHIAAIAFLGESEAKAESFKANNNLITPTGLKIERVKSWVLDRFEASKEALNFELSSVEEVNSLKKDIENVLMDFDLLATGNGDQTDLIRRYSSFITKNQIAEFNEAAERILGRDLDKSYAIRILTMARQNNKSTDDVLNIFNEMDKIGEQERNGVYDQYIILLTRASIEHGISPREVMDRFFEIDTLGANTKDGFTIHDLEVAILTDLSYKLNKTSQEMIDRFFVFQAYGKTYRGSGSFSYLNDPAIVYLTSVSFQEGSASPEDIINNFFTQYDLGRTTQDGFYINDLGLAILTGIGQRDSLVPIELNTRFFSIREEFMTKISEKEPFDEDYSRLASVSYAFNMSAAETIDLMVRLNGIAGIKLPITRAAKLISLISTANKIKGLSNVTDEDLKKIILLPLTTGQDIIDFLQDTVSVSNSGGSSSYTRSSVSDWSSSSSSDDDFGLNLVFDSGGLRPGLSLGGGLGLDLSDGSLTIGLGGGLSFDTDGSGLGFKF